MFIVPRPTESDIRAYFTRPILQTGDPTGARMLTARGAICQRAARTLRAWKAHGRILDVGCGSGLFLVRFMLPGGGWEGSGVELTESLAEATASKGVRVYAGSPSGADLPAAYFDAVTVLDSFYYFLEPEAELKAVRRSLKSDGILLLELPLGRVRALRMCRIGRRLAGTEASSQPVDAILYNPACLARLLQRADLECFAVYPCPGDGQENRLRQAAFTLWFWAAHGLWRMSFKRLLLSPRFLLLARPAAQL